MNWSKLSQRHLQPELMDQAELAAEHHYRALQGLARLNRISRASRLIWAPIQRLARDEQRRLRVLDVASGAGDIPIGLAKLARQTRVDVEIAGCDRSLRALEYARRRAERARVEVSFFPYEALVDEMPQGYDVITSSLFLHHLRTNQVEQLLREMAAAAGRLLVVADLQRSRSSWLLTYFATRLLTPSHVVHTDGPRSVEAAFTIEEIRRLAAQVPLANAHVVRRWPCRFLLVWRKP